MLPNLLNCLSTPRIFEEDCGEGAGGGSSPLQVVGSHIFSQHFFIVVKYTQNLLS